jgi:NAD(P) transhydrogenase subunit alpha
VREGGVTILAPSNLPAAMPEDASTLYARNVLALLQLLLEKEEGAPPRLELDLEDEVVAGSLLTHGGRIVHEPTAQALQEVAK